MIQAEITVSGQLPHDLPDDEYERVIKQALNWFYINYRHAVEVQYYVIQNHWFSNPQFQKSRSVLLPDCVVSVYECKEIKGGGIIGIVGGEFSINRMVASELFFSSFVTDDLVLRTAQYAFWDLSKAYILEHVGFEFNTNTKRLKITGRTPKANLFLETYIKIEENKLFEDWYFQRYCVCQCKKSLSRMLSAFTYSLPGGITINTDLWANEADSELEKILAKIDEENSPDWLFIVN